MSNTVLVFLIAGLFAQPHATTPAALAGAEDRAADPATEAAARLVIMRQSLVVLNVHPIDDRGASFRLQPEPIFRFTNPVGSSVDGAIFFWLGENDRPEAAVQVSFSRLDGRWFQEFVSLSPVPLIAESTPPPPWRGLRRAASSSSPCPAAPQARGDRRAAAPPDACPGGGFRRPRQLPGPVLAAAPPARRSRWHAMVNRARTCWTVRSSASSSAPIPRLA